MARAFPTSVVTVQDVAREAGLSPSTVSAVLTGNHVKRRISAETVELVRKAARRLRYIPNVTARSLRAKQAGTNHVVLTVLTSFEAPVFLVSQVLHSLDRELAALSGTGVRHTVGIQMFHAGLLHQVPGITQGNFCNGAIVANTIDADDQFLAATQLPFPVVLLGRRIPGYAGVSVKSELIGRKAAQILIEIGRRRLAVLQPSVLTQVTRSRLSAFVTLADEQIGVPPMIVTADGLTERAGYEAMRGFLEKNPRCDGIFATTDSLAIGAYRAFKAAGRQIPADVAVVGVGDNPASDFIDPALTCFESAEEAQHEAAARLLLELVSGHQPAKATIEVPVAALLRGSTGHDFKA